MTTPNGVVISAEDASARSDGTPQTAGGDITRVNAFNGLFLRAEHLTAMQDYSAALAHAVGAAGGPGVVEGLDVTLSAEGIRVGAGSAIDRAGRPLRTRHAVVVPWPDVEAGTGEFLVVEAVRASWGFGDAAVQALLCDAPCSGGTRERPSRAEGVLVRAVRRSTAEFAGEAPDAAHLRSWLAGRLFAEEETAGRGPGEGRYLADLTWRPGAAPAPVESPPVPLAVVIPTSADKAKWTLDVWAARRDRGAPPPDDHWRWRLGMRPWPLFVAQVLQFQDQFGGYLTGRAGPPAPTAAALLASLREVENRLQKGLLKDSRRDLIEHLIAQVEAPGGGAPAEPLPLAEVGFVDLPPAGMIAVRGQEIDEVAAELRRLVGTGVRVGIGGRCTIADTGELIEQARHRPRIPLVGGALEMFVPFDGTERSTDWVVFRSGSPHDPVAVYLVDHGANREAWHRHRAELLRGQLPPDIPHVADLDFPPGAAEVPEGGYARVRAAVDLLRTGREVIAFALVGDPLRRPLGVLRAQAVSVRFDADGVPDLTVTHTVVVEDGPEAVVVLGVDREQDGGGLL